MKTLHRLDAQQAFSLLASREITSEDLVRSCLERIEERGPLIHAFAHLNTDAAIQQASAVDAGAIRGALHGIPFGVKDLFDTADVPTSYGLPIYTGQTASVETAQSDAPTTCNPHNITHTLGGSSSGSAVAVADFMLPLALGTQTAGSLIRPAAFCGVVGFKPSHNRIAKAGVKSLSETLDTIGGFARSVRDVALLASVLTGDAASRTSRALRM